MWPLRPFTYPPPTKPTTTESQTKEKQSPSFIKQSSRSQTPPLTPFHPPSFPASSSSWCLSTCGGPALLHAASGPGAPPRHFRPRGLALPTLGQHRGRSGISPVGQNKEDSATGGHGALSGLREGWGGCSGAHLSHMILSSGTTVAGGGGAWSPKPTVHSSIK